MHCTGEAAQMQLLALARLAATDRRALGAAVAVPDVGLQAGGRVGSAQALSNLPTVRAKQQNRHCEL